MLRAIRICGAVTKALKRRGMEQLIEPVHNSGQNSPHSIDSQGFIRLVQKADRLAGMRRDGINYKGYSFAY